MRQKLKRLHFLLFLIGTVLAGTSYAQLHPVSGKVLEMGKPLEGATIKVEGKNKYTTTKADGTFNIYAENGDQLIITLVGYKSQKIKVSSADVNVSLIEEVSTLNDVVVTASGVKTKKREQGYTSTTIKGEELNVSKPTVLASALAGKVAGLEISGTNGGVNPSYRIILRGQRSLTGNNTALIILDNVIVPSGILGNINPQDIADVTVLNGASATALYGSQASNGALVVTTKRGKAGPPEINVSNTNTFESVAFTPKVQTDFGQGGDGYGIDVNGNPFFSPVENQAYGPRFDGTIRNLGVALADGSQNTAPYSYFKDRNKFWQTGTTNQTDFSISTGDEKSTLMFSGQYLSTTGTTWLDKYTRAAFRLNGSRKISDKININYGAFYTQNRYDVTSVSNGLYDYFLNMPGNIPITTFKDWHNDKFANPNGFYNPWYPNPYFAIENNRSHLNNDYFLGNVELKYAPLSWLSFTSRTGITVNSYSGQSTSGKFTYTNFAKTSSGGSKSDLAGAVGNVNAYTNQLTSTFLAEVKKNVKDFSFYFLAGGTLQQNTSNNTNASIVGLVTPDLYNLSNTLNLPAANAAQYEARQLGAYYELKIGYKNYLFLHTTGRNDWVSVLDVNNRSFFYPSVDVSFVATDAITALKTIKWLDVLKLRASASKVGQVNLKDYTYGAYALLPTFSQAGGYPYNGTAGYTVNNTIVARNLTPEITKGWETGLDFTLLKGMIDGSVTYYNTHTTNQTLTTSISSATGYSGFLTNTGETISQGVELRLALTPVKTKDWTVALNGTYTFNDNKVLSINAQLPRLSIASYANAGSYAVPTYQFPEIFGTDYFRDPQGHVIVDSKTGLPTVNYDFQALGNANVRNMIGLSPNIRYKQFNLSAVFEYRGGNKRYNLMGTSLDWSGMGIRTALFNRKRFVFPNSVIEDASGAYIKNTSVVVNQGNDGYWPTSTNVDASTNYISSGAYWKLRQLSLTYTVPTAALKATKAIKAATISVQGRNLFLWMPKDNLYTDPDYSGAGNDSNGIGLTGLESPPSRFYGFTVSLTF